MPKEYIERGALIARYDAEHVGPPGRARELMATAPAADVAVVRHGRWNRPYISWFLPLKIKNPHCFCTNCAYPMKHKKVTRFCPNCGALMDKEE